MPKLSWPRFSTPQASQAMIEQMRHNLLAEGYLSKNFLILTVSSCLIASFGLLSNSTAVIIGAMLVAPLMLPLRALAFGALEGDPDLFRRSLVALITATLISFTLAVIVGKLSGFQEFDSEVLARTRPNLIDLGIAVVAGGLSGFSKVQKGINDAVAGTAIAVALMPPLCVIGLTFSQGLFVLSQGALLLYLTNLLGIVLACMIVFILAGYAQLGRALGWTLLLTTFLVIPLGLSFFKLLLQSQIEYAIKRKFLEDTFTGRRVELVRSRIIWEVDPPKLYLSVRADQPITARQVGLVEAFLNQALDQNFALTLEVDPVETVTPQGVKAGSRVWGREDHEDRKEKSKELN